MTRFEIVPPAAMTDLVREAIGFDPASVEGIAELVRAEVTARRACARAAVLRRVATAAAVSKTDVPALEAVSDICDSLEREGDFVLASGGVLHATPVRVVDLGDSTLRVVTSVPTSRLGDGLAGTWQLAGTARTWRIDDLSRARSQVAALGGVVLTPAQWAGLDRAPIADGPWIDRIDRRLASTPELPGSLERDEVLRWLWLAASAAGVRWQASDGEPSAGLWKARDRWGRWRHAWTKDGSPRDAPFVTLSADEGARTVFALARLASASMEIAVTRDGTTAELEIPYWLPVAEHRYLAVLATPQAGEGRRGRWSIPVDRLPALRDALRERLGLTLRVEGPA